MVAVASHRKAVVAVDSGTLVVVARVAAAVAASPACYSVADLDIAAADSVAFDYCCCCCTYCSAVDHRSLLGLACRQAVVALAAAGPADCIGCGTGCIAADSACCFYFESYSESKDYSCDSGSSDRLVMAEESCPSLYWEEREKYVRSTMFLASAKQAIIIATGLPFFVRKIKQRIVQPFDFEEFLACIQ